MDDQDIQYEVRASYTPHYNDLLDRRNITILDIANTIKKYKFSNKLFTSTVHKFEVKTSKNLHPPFN